MSSSSEHGYLIDTNVLSEGRRRRPEARVLGFMRTIHGQPSYVSVLSLGELRKGAEMMRRVDPGGAGRLDTWIEEVEEIYFDRILDVDRIVADIWGRMSAVRERSVVDTLLAATALAHSLTMVTRNVRDFADTGVPVVNPWDGPQ